MYLFTISDTAVKTPPTHHSPGEQSTADTPPTADQAAEGVCDVCVCVCVCVWRVFRVCVCGVCFMCVCLVCVCVCACEAHANVLSFWNVNSYIVLTNTVIKSYSAFFANCS